MQAHPLPPLPTEATAATGAHGNATANTVREPERGWDIKQTRVHDEIGRADARSNVILDECKSISGTPDMNNSANSNGRRPIPSSNLSAPVLTHEFCGRTDEQRPRIKHTRRQLSIDLNDIFTQDQGETYLWSPREEYVQSLRSVRRNQSAPELRSPHVRFAGPIPHPLPPLPLPLALPARPQLHGARLPPWYSSDLGIERRCRMNMRVLDDPLSERLRDDMRRLAGERQVAEEEIRTGMRTTDAEELRELISGLYPDMTFESKKRTPSCCCCCCCVVM